MNRAADLAYWINERYAMKRRKENGLERPGHPDDPLVPWLYGWSDNPAMGTVRYCNVHREDDKVTRWLAANWRPKHHAVWEIVLARMINYIPSLAFILSEPEGTDGAGKSLKIWRSMGEKVFTSAYTISTCGQRMDKIDYVMGVVSSVREHENQPADVPFWDSGLAGFHRWLMRVDGLGSFLAAQVAADLKNTTGHPLQQAPDWWQWAAPGPGSLRGLEAFLGHPVTPAGFTAALAYCAQVTLPLVDPEVPRISMQDLQNCLCEFSKYIRVKEGNGHVRNKYRPG